MSADLRFLPKTRTLVAAACQNLAVAAIRRVYATIHSNVSSREVVEISGFRNLGLRNVEEFFLTKIEASNWSPASPRALVEHKGV